ncbi:hypothetical protein DNTS_009908, partial [Danionella cerebrum]
MTLISRRRTVWNYQNKIGKTKSALMVRLWMSLFAVFACLGLWEPVETRRARFKPTPPKPQKTETDKAIENLTPSQSFTIDQMSGKWYLLSVACRCKNLLNAGFKLESTTVTWTIASEKVSVSTMRQLNFVCYEIKQKYMTTKSSGQFILKGKCGKRPADDVDVVVLETDYRSYAVLVFKKGTNITVKLYGRSGDVPDNIVDKFEGHAKTFNLGLDVVFPYPAYGFCEAAERVMGKII